MSAPDGPVTSDATPQPPDELLLAQALDACLQAERETPGASAAIVERAPQGAQAELRALVALAQALETTAPTARPRPGFREAARARLLRRIAADVPPPATPVAAGRTALSSAIQARASRRTLSVLRLPWRGRNPWAPPAPIWATHWPTRFAWLARVAAGLAALSLAGFAAVGVSASALPGDVLYPVKEASEALAVQLAPDDEARARVLLRQADARVEEAARLVDQGRAADGAAAARRYEDTLSTAMAQVLALAERQTAAPASAADATEVNLLQAKLEEQQARLERAIEAAPEAAKPGLSAALAASARGLDRVAEVQSRPRPGRPARAEPTAPAAGATPAPRSVEPDREREDQRDADRGDDRQAGDADERPPAPRRAGEGEARDAERRQRDEPPGTRRPRTPTPTVGQADGSPLPAAPSVPTEGVRRDDEPGRPAEREEDRDRPPPTVRSGGTPTARELEGGRTSPATPGPTPTTRATATATPTAQRGEERRRPGGEARDTGRRDDRNTPDDTDQGDRDH